MIHSTSRALAFAAVMIALSSGVYADTSPSDFTFSDELTAAFETHSADVVTFNETVTAAIEGLSNDEAQAMFATYAEEAEALRAEGQALRDEGVAEMEAEGLTPAAQDNRDRPETSNSDDSDDSSDSDDADRSERPERGQKGPRPDRS